MTVDTSIEVWKDIPEYEGLYQVSNLGRVKGLDRTVVAKNGIPQFKRGTVLKNKLGTNNYHYVILYKNNKGKTFMNHTLVALVFIGNRPSNHDICHIDGDRFNNQASNLRYDTRSENRIDDYRNGKKNPRGKLSIEQVLEIRERYKNGGITHKGLAEAYKMSESQINAIVNKTSYKWLNDDGTIRESDTATTY